MCTRDIHRNVKGFSYPIFIFSFPCLQHFTITSCISPVTLSHAGSLLGHGSYRDMLDSMQSLFSYSLLTSYHYPLMAKCSQCCVAHCLNHLVYCEVSNMSESNVVCLLFRCVEGSGCPYHHDWYSDRPAVVHLRLCQGLLPPAPSPSPRDAWVPEEEARPHRVTLPPPALHWAPVSSRHIWTPSKLRVHSSFLYLCPPLPLLYTEHRAATNVYFKIRKQARREDGAVALGLPWVTENIPL